MIKVQLKKKLVTSEGRIDLDVDLQIQRGEWVTLFGKSGVGKTSLLRMIAGLMMPDEGFVQVGEEVWFDSHQHINVPIQKRKMGFVFQDYTLFPNMTVEENLRFALANPDDAPLMEEFLEMLNLVSLRHRKPGVLSGGQKQRVAFIRALLRRPKIFLLDEPFSALDLELRLTLQNEMLDIYKRLGTTTIFVSHDIGEVHRLSSRVFVLEKGRIVKSGTPNEIFLDQSVSGKFKFVGNLLSIEKEDFLHILTVQIGNQLTKVVATAAEIQNLKIGQKVMVASKAFNPLLLEVVS
ncbi:MAG: ATP-binding cassette domain-containing protein [Candidatus Omnitrophica bacterium]|nr:ATP-binding cassette domain-containing protein [Candidatus Omnitrophota bacterium]